MVEIFNTGETPTQLKEIYNPEGSVLRKAQLRMLDMLLYLDRVCKELHIDYRLDGGNVLGAVRHGGFIPWDDDVDIVIEDKKDYNRLCNYLLTHNDSQYVLQNHETDSGYFQFWSVLRDTKSEYVKDEPRHNTRKYKGLQVDIFPMENKRIVWINSLCAHLSRNNLRYFIGKNIRIANFIYCFLRYVIIPIGNLLSTLFGNKDYYMHSYGDTFRSRRCNKILFPHSTVTFEGYEFPAPANVHEFLVSLYGNYMDLPPVEKRDHHKADYKIWD